MRVSSGSVEGRVLWGRLAFGAILIFGGGLASQDRAEARSNRLSQQVSQFMGGFLRGQETALYEGKTLDPYYGEAEGAPCQLWVQPVDTQGDGLVMTFQLKFNVPNESPNFPASLPLVFVARQGQESRKVDVDGNWLRIVPRSRDTPVQEFMVNPLFDIEAHLGRARVRYESRNGSLLFRECQFDN